MAPIWKTSLLTILALIAFASNSVLCRMALGDQSIDAASFTGIRLFSGSLTLLLLVFLSFKPNKRNRELQKGSWISGALLFLYAACFSYAYISLETGTGALIVFTSVQITMITYAIIHGRQLSSTEWIGMILAFGGFIYLVSPGVSAPSLEGFILMTVSGFGWGMYSVRGKLTVNPLEDTAFNFVRSLPFVLLLLALGFNEIKISNKGMILALTSGALTSGIGYTIWYMALKGMNNVQASVVQLLVPAFAALGGVLVLSEKLSLRLILSSLIILGGIFLVITARRRNRLRNDP